jgi:hypothetical protein
VAGRGLSFRCNSGCPQLLCDAHRGFLARWPGRAFRGSKACNGIVRDIAPCPRCNVERAYLCVNAADGAAEYRIVPNWIVRVRLSRLVAWKWTADAIAATMRGKGVALPRRAAPRPQASDRPEGAFRARLPGDARSPRKGRLGRISSTGTPAPPDGRRRSQDEPCAAGSAIRQVRISAYRERADRTIVNS